MLYALGYSLSWLVLKIFFRFRSLGKQNVPRTGGALIACTHQSFLDPMMVGTGVGLRKVAFMARRSLFRTRFFAWVLRSANTFAVNRGEVDPAAVKLAVEKMKAGELLLVFPEGTRTTDGTIGEIRPGTAMMASRAGVPIIPAVIHGAFEAWPKHARLPRFRRVRIVFGEPIDTPGHRRGQRLTATELLIARLHELQANLIERDKGRKA